MSLKGFFIQNCWAVRFSEISIFIILPYLYVKDVRLQSHSVRTFFKSGYWHDAFHIVPIAYVAQTSFNESLAIKPNMRLPCLFNSFKGLCKRTNKQTSPPTTTTPPQWGYYIDCIGDSSLTTEPEHTSSVVWTCVPSIWKEEWKTNKLDVIACHTQAYALCWKRAFWHVFPISYWVFFFKCSCAFQKCLLTFHGFAQQSVLSSASCGQFLRKS